MILWSSIPFPFPMSVGYLSKSQVRGWWVGSAATEGAAHVAEWKDNTAAALLGWHSEIQV
jgi:hypothetical protein